MKFFFIKSCLKFRQLFLFSDYSGLIPIIPPRYDSKRIFVFSCSCKSLRATSAATMLELYQLFHISRKFFSVLPNYIFEKISGWMQYRFRFEIQGNRTDSLDRSFKLSRKQFRKVIFNFLPTTFLTSFLSSRLNPPAK